MNRKQRREGAKQYKQTSKIKLDDAMVCLGCGETIWRPPLTKEPIPLTVVDRHYQAHLKKCFALKRLVVTDRKKRKNEALLQ